MVQSRRKRKSMSTKKLIDDIEISLPFAVATDEQPQARALVRRYRHSEVVLRLLHDYYTALPDAHEEAVTRVAFYTARAGVQFLVLTTTGHHWLYAVSPESVALVGEYGAEMAELPADVVRFLGFASRRACAASAPRAGELDEYPEQDRTSSCCPACGVHEGEPHLLGCAVEVCPWCDGQLKNCNCRFEQLGVDEITREEQVMEFLELLEKKGRIVFVQEQSPAYPGTSGGLDSKEGQ